MKEEEKQKLEALLNRLGSLTKEEYTRIGETLVSLGIAQSATSQDDVTKAFKLMSLEQHEQLADKLVDIEILLADERDLLVSLVKETRWLKAELQRKQVENAQIEKELMELREKLRKKIFYH